MSVFEKYKMKRPTEFTRLVGVNFGTFQIILKKLENEITRYKQQKPMRTRGLKSSLTIADQLLLTLIYLRQYHTFLQLGEMFSISESYAQKRYTFISKRLMKALDLPNDKDLKSENLKLIADVTEQEIERPIKEQKSYYSGKKSDTPSKPY
jgi:Helix-turn-helix of DDE superfamily endonuclease